LIDDRSGCVVVRGVVRRGEKLLRARDADERGHGTDERGPFVVAERLHAQRAVIS
jgi:hypothetical protein